MYTDTHDRTVSQSVVGEKGNQVRVEAALGVTRGWEVTPGKKAEEAPCEHFLLESRISFDLFMAPEYKTTLCQF